MIVAVMVYASLMALLFAGAAFFIEKLIARTGWARRHVWIAALVASLLVPGLLLWMTVSERPSITPMAAPLGSILTRDLSVAEVRVLAIAANVWWRSREWDFTLCCAWAALSLTGGLLWVGAWARISHTARRWPSVQIDGSPVRVTDATGPAVFGVWKPVVLLPRWILDQPPTLQAAVMAHEREHIAARDPLVLLITQWLIVLLPWNLPLWWMLRKLRFAIEVDCDARVVRRGVDAAGYGQALFAVSRRSSQGPLLAASLIEPVSQLEQRLQIMLSKDVHMNLLRTTSYAVLAAVLAACASRLPVPDLPDPPAPVAHPLDGDIRVDYMISDAPGAPHNLRKGVLMFGPELDLEVLSSASSISYPDRTTILEGDVRISATQKSPPPHVTIRFRRATAGEPVISAFTARRMTVRAEKAVFTPQADGGAKVEFENGTIQTE